MDAAVQSGVNCLISAGGDGSVNMLINALVDTCGEQMSEYAVGGIGLGSSNDFVKPVRTRIGGCPTRLNPEGVVAADVVRIRLLNPEGLEEQRYFLLNASMGVTADANWLFNRGDWFLDLLKPRFVAGSILYAAVKAILMHRNFPAELEVDGRQYRLQLSNLAILKSPHVAGALLYDKHVSPDDGFLAVNYCDGMSKLELLKTLSDLRKGRFVGPPKRVCHRARVVRLQTATPAALEMDGEVVMATSCSIDVLPSQILLLGT